MSTKALLPHKPDNCTIQITTDASAAFFADLADIVLLGADQVNPDKGDVKNKIGSLSAAQNTRGYVWCVASTDKIETGYEMEVEENDVEEVTRMWPWGESVEGVTVRNVYFEWVDGKFIEWYITEQGTLDKQKLKDIYLEREALKGVWNILG